MFAELPGVTDVEPPATGIPRVTEMQGKTYATINAKLRFRVNGNPVDLDFSGEKAIVVVWNKAMGVDALHGKAKKRIYAYAYRYVSGRTFDEVDPSDIIDGQVIGESESEQPTPSAPESTQAAETDQSIDLESDAANQLKACKTTEDVDACVRTWLEEEGIDIRELGELKKQALLTVGRRGGKR
jgi:hypothetical protein